MRMLVDSGAAISVVRNDVLSDSCRKKMTMTQKTAVGANGLPLKIMGQLSSCEDILGHISSDSNIGSGPGSNL